MIRFADGSGEILQIKTQAALLIAGYQKQVQQLKATAKNIATLVIAIFQATATEQVKKISKRSHKAYYMKAAGFSYLGTSLLFTTG